MVDESKPRLVNPEFAKKVVNEGAKTLMLCFQCGTCTGSCPSGRHTAFRIRKLIRKTQLGFGEDVLPSDELWMCTTCFTCAERCPRGVEITGIIMTLRNMAVKQGYMAEPHKRVAQNVVRTGMTIPLMDQFKNMRKTLGLSEVPPTTLSDEKALKDLQKIIGKTGFESLIGGEK
jgi:heterodisulfide reductase subunit C